jgi:hypothetical protein
MNFVLIPIGKYLQSWKLTRKRSKFENFVEKDSQSKGKHYSLNLDMNENTRLYILVVG